jgi:hypothetical protein
MEFDTTGELANHKAKFCVLSKYGSQNALKKNGGTETDGT